MDVILGEGRLRRLSESFSPPSPFSSRRLLDFYFYFYLEILPGSKRADGSRSWRLG